MKMTRFSQLFLVGLAIAVAASGCKTKSKPPITEIRSPAITPAVTPTPTVTPTVTPTPTPIPTRPEVTRPSVGPGPGTNPDPGPGSGTAIPPGPTSAEVTPIVPFFPTNGIASNPAGSHDGWIPNAEILQADTTYFAFDSSVVRPSEQPKVAAVADYLKTNPNDAVRVEGHCDERGTEEYNRALGERRALAIREELVRLGIEPGRVDTISYGKDRPKAPGHDESSWRQNRRGEFIVLMPPKLQ